MSKVLPGLTKPPDRLCQLLRVVVENHDLNMVAAFLQNLDQDMFVMRLPIANAQQNGFLRLEFADQSGFIRIDRGCDQKANGQ